MRLIFVLLLLGGCGSSAAPPAAGGPIAPGGACTSMTTAVCMGKCQVCLLPHVNGTIDFDHGSCAALCDNPGGACTNGKRCTLLKEVPKGGSIDYNDSGECDPAVTAVCI